MNSSKKSKLICFIDDDVSIGGNYFLEIIKVFNIKKAVAVSATGKGIKLNYSILENYLKKIFLLSNYENNQRILSPYGNTAPKKVEKIVDAQWLGGTNMIFKKEIFDRQKFDENLLGYTVVEDLDFTYRLWKKYPRQILLTPYAKINHRYSHEGRSPTKKLSYINQIDHFYFYFKDFKHPKDILLLLWPIFGISILRTTNLIVSPNKNNYLKWKYFFESLLYCITNLNKIRSGRIREFITN
jgi:GT2 family glycosyltransferase